MLRAHRLSRSSFRLISEILSHVRAWAPAFGEARTNRCPARDRAISHCSNTRNVLRFIKCKIVCGWCQRFLRFFCEKTVRLGPESWRVTDAGSAPRHREGPINLGMLAQRVRRTCLWAGDGGRACQAGVFFPIPPGGMDDRVPVMNSCGKLRSVALAFLLDHD
jgi:bacterioferritin-associated ferredoxin